MPKQSDGSTMGRRAFVETAALGIVMLNVNTNGARKISDNDFAAAEPITRPVKLAGLSLQDLKQRYRNELFGVLIPYWDKHGIDHQRGGFMCALDHDGRRVNTDKFLWFQGRGIWVYTYLYTHFGRNPRYLEVARKTRDFALTYFRNETGEWAQIVSREGKVLQPPTNDPSGALYMAEGLQAYAHATGDSEGWQVALDTIKKQFRQTVHPPKADSADGTFKQGFWFLNLLIATQILRHTRDSEIAAIADHCIDAIIEHHYNPDTGLNNEVINRDFSKPRPESTKTIIGHSIEALWMVMEEGRRRGDQKLITTCEERLRRHLEVGWDRVYGGLVHAVNVDQGGYLWPAERPVGTDLDFRFVGEYHYMKTTWSLYEVLLSCLKVLEHRGTDWAARYFDMAQEFLDHRMSLNKYGHPLHMLFTDRQATYQPHSSRQENYHNFRSLMFNLQALDRMTRS
jgi:N-acylglucosamine 2-epimerase